MNDHTEIETPPSNAFARLLQEQRAGDCLTDASEKLQDLILKVRERLGAGEIIIKLKLTPAAKGIITITDDVTVKLPKEDKDATLFWTTEDGTLTRNDPDQPELILRQVKSPNQPLREVPSEEQRLRSAGAE